MIQPRCCLCGEKIKANEHYYIFRGGRSVCRNCGVRHDVKSNRGGACIRYGDVLDSRKDEVNKRKDFIYEDTRDTGRDSA